MGWIADLLEGMNIFARIYAVNLLKSVHVFGKFSDLLKMEKNGSTGSIKAEKKVNLEGKRVQVFSDSFNGLDTYLSGTVLWAGLHLSVVGRHFQNLLTQSSGFVLAERGACFKT